MSEKSNCSLRCNSNYCTDSKTIDRVEPLFQDRITIDKSDLFDQLIGSQILSGTSKSIDLNRLKRQYSIDQMSPELILEQLYHRGIYDIHLLTTRNLMNKIEWLVPDSPLPLELHPIRPLNHKLGVLNDSPNPMGIIPTPLKVIEYYRPIMVKEWICQLQTLLTATREFDLRELNIRGEYRCSLMDLEEWTPRSTINTTEHGFNNLTAVAAKFIRARLFKINGVTPSQPPLMISGSDVQYNGTMKMTKYLRMIEGERINAWECGDLFRLLWLSSSNGDNLRPILSNLKTDRWPSMLKLLYIYKDLVSNHSERVKFKSNFNELNRCEQILLVRTVFNGHIEPHFLTTQQLYRSLIDRHLPVLDPNIYIRYTRYIKSSESVIVQLMRLYRLQLPLIASLNKCDRSNMERLILDNESDLEILIDRLSSHRLIHGGLKLEFSSRDEDQNELNKRDTIMRKNELPRTKDLLSEILIPMKEDLKCESFQKTMNARWRKREGSVNEMLRNLVHYKWIVDNMDDLSIPNIWNLGTMTPLNLLCHTDNELIEQLNLNNPFGCRIRWLINMYRCMIKERFFVPLKRKSINKRTLLYTKISDYECFMVAYGTLFRYRMYEPLELYQSFESIHIDVSSDPAEISEDRVEHVRQSIDISLSMAKGESSDILRLPNQVVHFNRPYRKENDDYSEFSNSDIRMLKWILKMRKEELLTCIEIEPTYVQLTSNIQKSNSLIDIDQLIRRINNGLESRKILEVFRTELKIQFRRLNRHDLKLAIEWLSVLFKIGMYMRKWKGDSHPYPLLESDTLGTYDEGPIVDSFGHLGEIELRMSLKMRDRVRDLISYDLRHGHIINHHRSIGFYIDRVVLNDDKSDAGCIRVNSTIFIGTAYAYLSFLFDSPPSNFNPKCLEGIQ